MNIKKILVSQPTPTTEKSPFYDLASKYNLETVFRPFIDVEGVTFKEFRKQKIEILDHSAVIMTSRTAVDHFFRICDESRITVPETMKYFCVSEAIANYLQKYIVYRKRKIFFSTGTFIALMETVMKHKDEKYLVPLSAPHKPEIPVLLGKSGVKHNIVILSRTVSSDLKDVNPNDYDILALYSPADVVSFTTNFSQIGKHDFKVAIFGEGAARAALEAGIKVDIMSPTKQFPSMIMALDKFIQCFNKGGDTSEFALTTLPEPQSIDIGKKSRTKSTPSGTKTISSK